MVQTSLPTFREPSRLEKLLVELSSAKLDLGEHNLAERLSYLIGVSGSINLARSLKQLPAKVELVSGDDVLLETDLAESCQQMMLVITSSFVAEEGAEYHETQ